MRLLRPVLAALLPLAAMPAAAQVDPAQQEKVMRFVRDFAGTLDLGDAAVTITFIDLNGDGVEEALARIDGRNFCGTRGCSAFALDLTGADARSVGDFTAHELAALPNVTNGWFDVTLGGGSRFTFDGARYQFAGR